MLTNGLNAYAEFVFFTASLRSCIDDLAGVALKKAAPWPPRGLPDYQARVVVKLPYMHYLAVATLELILEGCLNRSNPERLKLRLGMDLKKLIGEFPHEFPFMGLIHGTTLRDALERELISRAEAEQLLGKKPWAEERGAKLADVATAAQSDLELLESLAGRLVGQLVPPALLESFQLYTGIVTFRMSLNSVSEQLTQLSTFDAWTAWMKAVNRVGLYALESLAGLYQDAVPGLKRAVSTGLLSESSIATVLEPKPWNKQPAPAFKDKPRLQKILKADSALLIAAAKQVEDNLVDKALSGKASVS